MSSVRDRQELSHYEVLGLTVDDSDGASSSQGALKAAYRRALLQHHPDKAVALRDTTNSERKPSVDEITLAYQVLADKSRREEYDKSLRQKRLTTDQKPVDRRAGLETVDLDDMLYDPSQDVWSRGCRCGNRRGFRVTEQDLESEVDRGEIIVGCEGCSLWLKITFQPVGDA